MADVQEEELELADGGGGGSKKKLIIIIVAAVLVLIGGTVGALYLTGVFSPADEETAEGAGGEEGGEAPAEKAIYVSLEPAFTVNLQPGSKAKYLQVNMQVLTRDPETEAHIKEHMPVIRNNLLLVMGSKSYQDIAGPEGKAALQQEVRNAIGKVLKAETGEDNVESVLFTSFVMQ